MKVVLLVGGVGGAKLAYGLANTLPAEDLTVIVNTGDDFWLHGLRVCPDLDTVIYTLSGLVDPVNGWGVAGDTTHALDALQRYGEDTWFRLGDQDIATHLLRTRWLHGGHTLTHVTEQLTRNLGIPQRILPMTDAQVSTMVDTVEYGELAFQTYFVKHRWQPTLRGLQFEGIERSDLSEAVRTAVEQADVLLIGPSNPWLSIDPILSVDGMRDLIKSRRIPRVALSPIVGGMAIKGPAAKLMAELGIPVTAAAVAEHYGDLINGYVLDRVDAGLSVPVARVANFETVMKTNDDKVILAQTMLEWIRSWM